MTRLKLALMGAACVQALASVEAAEIATATTTPVATSTANAGNPDDITITSAGSITLNSAATAPAVTLDSDHDVAHNGAIVLDERDGAIGIFIVGGHTGSVSGVGDIAISDGYTRVDTDGDGDLDGVYAEGVNRAAILLDAGGAFLGDIRIGASSLFTVDGNQSAGIRLNSLLDGSLIHDGGILVIGEDAVGVDIRAGATGDVRLSGAVEVNGLDAVGVSVRGPVDGNVTIESVVAATGFASRALSNYVAPGAVTPTTPPLAERIDAEDLLDNAAGFAIGGSVAEGVLNNGLVGGRDPDDEIKNAVEDFDENRSPGSISSFGSGPALYVSPDWDPAGGDIFIGRVVERVRDTTDDDDDDDIDEQLAQFTYNYGIVNRGAIFADGLNVGFDATAMRIEGSADGTRSTTIEGGIFNGDSITARAFEADATAISIGMGAVVEEIATRMRTSISASVSSVGANQAVAILVEAGADVDRIVNAGSITASVSGELGDAVAIRDLSGGLDVVRNAGFIAAALTSDGPNAPPTGDAVAIDLSLNAAGVQIIQEFGVPTLDTNADGDIDADDLDVPSILGDVWLGAGGDLVDVRAGSIDGDIRMGAGADSLLIAAGGVEGDVDFGAGADLLMITAGGVFRGAIADSDQALNIFVEDATFGLANSNPLVLSTLDVSGASVIEIDVDLAAANSALPRITALNSATISADVDIRATISNFENAATTIILIESPLLTIEDGAAADFEVETPAIFTTSVDIDATQLRISIAPKTAAALGLNLNETAAYQAVLGLAAANSGVGAALTSYFDEAALLQAYQSLMPVTHDAATRFLSSQSTLASGPLSQRLDLIARRREGANGVWAQQFVSYLDQPETAAVRAYDGYGLSFQAGADRAIGESLHVGFSGGFLSGDFSTDERFAKSSETTSLHFGPYLSAAAGPFRLDVAAAYGLVTLAESRTASFGAVTEIIDAVWQGRSTAGSARLSATLDIGGFYARPQATIDYFRLKQDAYEETPSTAGSALALAIDEASTKRVSSSAILEFGRAGSRRENERSVYGAGAALTEDLVWFQNIYAGYRVELDSTAYSTTAQFLSGGGPFAISDPTGYDNAVLVGASIGLDGGLYAISFSYDGEFGDGTNHHAGVTMRLRF